MAKMIEKVITIPDTTVITREHIDRWVALSPDYRRVIASGDTLSEVLKAAKNMKRKVVFKVLPDIGYVPALR